MKIRRLLWKPMVPMMLYLQFFSKMVDPSSFGQKTLNSNEKRYASVKKEAAAIAEAVRRWSHYLLLRKFTVVKHQSSVAFMFGNSRRNKIKNDKIMWWRIELSQYCHNIVYRQGEFIKGNAWIKLLFSGHIANKFRRPTIFQLNIEGLTASKMNVLHYLALQSEALVILLQETHFTDAEKLVLPHYQLAGSSLSRKHGLATFVHERLRYTLLDRSPLTSEIEWLCGDVDGYKIVNVYKLPLTRLQSLDLPVFPHPCLYVDDFNCRHADWGYDDSSRDSKCLAGWASINCFALRYNAKASPVFIPAAGTLAPIQI